MLTNEQLDVLDFERSSWLRPGPKDLMIELDLGLGSALYYEILLDLVVGDEAYETDPLTIARLRRLIEGRAEPDEAIV